MTCWSLTLDLEDSGSHLTGSLSLDQSGQVRSECLMCTFRASCCSAHLSRAQVPAFASSSVQDRTGSVRFMLCCELVDYNMDGPSLIFVVNNQVPGEL